MNDNVINCFYKILKNVSRDNCARFMKNHYPTEYNDLITSTKFLDKFDVQNDKNKKISIFERIYCLEHGLTDRPRCSYCQKNYVNGFNKQKNEYRKWCSPHCQASDKTCINKSKKTRKNKYGNENYAGNDKARETRMLKYGSYHPSNFGSKVKNTKIKHFGCDNFVNSEKMKYTKKLKYGSENYNNSVKNKVSRKTNFFKNILMKDEHMTPLFSVDDYIKCDNKTVLEWMCKDCGNIFKSKFNYNFKYKINYDFRVRCPVCFPRKEISVSNSELEMREYIKSVSKNEVTFLNRNIINPYELDIVIEKSKIAFEFDGLYWHSESCGKDRNYHLMKLEMCKDVGYRLIHIFEDEWNDKNEIVKSRIKNILGFYDKTIYARKCVVKEICASDEKDFINKNHIQGYCRSSYAIGLYYDNELISMMTFGKSRFSKKYEWELLRFCSKLGYHIPGAAGKLLKFFELNKHPMSLISYADRRWSDGNVYDKLGFTKSGCSKPNYWYLDNTYSKRYSRLLFQKHKLESMLDVFDINKTEYENMKENGYSRIFDCGNLVYVKEYKKTSF